MEWPLVGGIVLSLLLVWVAFIALLWALKPKDTRLAELVGVVPDVLRLVRDLIADRTAPLGVRLALVGLLAWLLNPVDLIPEFMPVLGPLDDVVVAMLVLRYVRRRLGEERFRASWPGTAQRYAILSRVL